MKGLHGNHRKGPEHSRWSGEKLVSSTGYVKLRVGKGHPLADPNGYAYEHLVVWVSAGNPRPPGGTLLHHKNGDKHDNRIGNLELMRRGEHNRAHLASRLRDAATGRLKPARASTPNS